MKDKDNKAVETAANGAAEAANLKDVCGQRGCFSYQDGRCGCLSDTDFGGRACSFFKTVKQYERDLAAHPMKAGGDMEEDDFLAANRDLIDELASIEDEAERIEREGCGEDPGSDDDDWDDVNDEDGQYDGGGEDGESDG